MHENVFKNKINLITTLNFIHKSHDVTTIIDPQVALLLNVLVLLLLNVLETFIGVYVYYYSMAHN